MPDDGLALGHGETRISGIRRAVQVVADDKGYIIRCLIGHSALKTEGAGGILSERSAQRGGTAGMQHVGRDIVGIQYLTALVHGRDAAALAGRQRRKAHGPGAGTTRAVKRSAQNDRLAAVGIGYLERVALPAGNRIGGKYAVGHGATRYGIRRGATGDGKADGIVLVGAIAVRHDLSGHRGTVES